jgi:hypothetical protein
LKIGHPTTIGWVITVQDWAQVRYLHGSEGMSIRAIAARLGLSRDTVARAVASSSPPRYSRVLGPSAFDSFEGHVRQLLAEFPPMPATVIAERVGWPGSQSWFRKKVAAVRVEYAPKDPADRLSYWRGDPAQCDLWFPPATVSLGARQHGSPPVLVMVASFSRFITGRMIPTRTTPDLLAGMWSLLDGQLGAVPRRLVWDKEAGVGRGGKLAVGVAAFTGTLAARVVQLKPNDPESKGIVEGQRLSGELVPAWSFVCLAGRLQHPAGRVADAGEYPPGPQPGCASGRSDRAGSGRDESAATGPAGDRVHHAGAAAPRLLPAGAG